MSPPDLPISHRDPRQEAAFASTRSAALGGVGFTRNMSSPRSLIDLAPSHSSSLKRDGTPESRALARVSAKSRHARKKAACRTNSMCRQHNRPGACRCSLSCPGHFRSIEAVQAPRVRVASRTDVRLPVIPPVAKTCGRVRTVPSQLLSCDAPDRTANERWRRCGSVDDGPLAKQLGRVPKAVRQSLHGRINTSDRRPSGARRARGPRVRSICRRLATARPIPG